MTYKIKTRLNYGELEGLEIFKCALNFVHKREHKEGGFTLYEGLPDGKNTYYGLLILKMFNENSYNEKETIGWVENLNKGRIFGTKSVFYRLNIFAHVQKAVQIFI